LSRILVTGGAGFVGSNLINRLLLDGHSIVSVDNYSNGLFENQISGVKYLNFDIASEDSWKQTNGEKFDVVFHLAAQASNAISFRNPVEDLKINQLATLNVIAFCQRADIKRLIFTSSMSVYGNPTIFPTPSSELPNPETYYGIHKAASEKYVSLSKNINWSIFRLYTTYGSGQNLANLDQGLVKIFLGYVLRGEPIKVHGSLDRIRDIIHVSDAVEALVKSLENKNSFQKIYNLGTGVTLTVGEIIEQIVKESGNAKTYPIEIETGDIGDPHKTQANIADVQQDLEWKPKIGPSEGISRTILKYLAN
jgi:UDP-glucose 4-epimerase